jgi:hypothetical protein
MNELLKIFLDPAFGAIIIGIAFATLTIIFYIIFLFILLRIRKESIRTNKNLDILIRLFLKRKRTSAEKKDTKDRGKFKLGDNDVKKLKDLGIGLE